MSLVLSAAAGPVPLDDRRDISLQRRHGEALAWVVVGAATIGLVAVGYRALAMP